MPIQAQAQEPSLPEYAALIREATAAARRNDRLGLEETTARLLTVDSVRLADGTRAPVDNTWLRVALESPDPDFPAIAMRLGAITDSLAQPASTTPPDAQERLQQILSNPPFERPESPPPPPWLDDFFNWLGRVLEWIFSPFDTIGATNNPIVGGIFALIGILLLMAIAIYLVRSLRRTMTREVATDTIDPEANLTAGTALGQATDKARGGDYRTAMRFLYLSALLWLDERDLIYYDRALTNREYLEQLNANPGLQTRLAPVIETFDRVWYGHTPIDEQTFDAYRRQIEALRENR